MKAYVIKNRDGDVRECEYVTREEALQGLAKMQAAAQERDRVCVKWLAEHPKPWGKDDAFHASLLGYDSEVTNEEKFLSQDWHVAEKEATPAVYRLNTLPAESPEMVREIEAKVEAFGECEVGWTCHGHTRAEWQSEAACVQLKKMHPEWDVCVFGMHVEIKKGGLA